MIEDKSIHVYLYQYADNPYKYRGKGKRDAFLSISGKAMLTQVAIAC
jgi:hypothetical protein